MWADYLFKRLTTTINHYNHSELKRKKKKNYTRVYSVTPVLENDPDSENLEITFINTIDL